MLADRRTRTVHHDEWTLEQPAHFTDVYAAIDMANREHDKRDRPLTDVYVKADDEQIIIGYQYEETK
jgi:hypothetical protein